MAIQKEMQAQCGRRAGFAACYGTFALNGMLALTVGALLPYIRDSYALGYAYAAIHRSVGTKSQKQEYGFSASTGILVYS